MDLFECRRRQTSSSSDEAISSSSYTSNSTPFILISQPISNSRLSLSFRFLILHKVRNVSCKFVTNFGFSEQLSDVLLLLMFYGLKIYLMFCGFEECLFGVFVCRWEVVMEKFVFGIGREVVVANGW
ncbi:hypothetical protein Pint_28894 [Pistacia integerrima]|uniref:Uncharacterized protein n=1 Tax=Pistacia integerrima TaxID=434235 RepID=A0ACC0X1X8_9ROSI|nr:hypothetical protein Pint_28894 [Pistacia integerrima]